MNSILIASTIQCLKEEDLKIALPADELNVLLSVFVKMIHVYAAARVTPEHTEEFKVAAARLLSDAITSPIQGPPLH